MPQWFLKYRKQIGIGAAIIIVLFFVGFYMVGTRSEEKAEISPTPISVKPTKKPTPTPIEPTPTLKPLIKPTAIPTLKPTSIPTPTNTPTPTPTTFSVTGATAAVSPTDYTGVCPKQFNFTANITANAPGTVTYKWARSDGAGAPTETMTFASAGTKAANPDSWTLSSPGSKWEKIQILTPNTLESNQATFTLVCL